MATGTRRQAIESNWRTTDWAKTMTKVVVRFANKAGARWHVIGFEGPQKRESRGIVDLLVVRKDHSRPPTGLKAGDRLELVLMQVKGGSAPWPSDEDVDRLREVARQHKARAVVLSVYIFLLTKSDRYFCDAKAVREVYISNPPLGNTWDERKQRPINDGREKINLRSDNFRSPGGFTQTNSGRNRRTVWQIATQPYSGAHFATFPEALVEPCVKAQPASAAAARCAAANGQGWWKEKNRRKKRSIKHERI